MFSKHNDHQEVAPKTGNSCNALSSVLQEFPSNNYPFTSDEITDIEMLEEELSPGMDDHIFSKLTVIQDAAKGIGGSLSTQQIVLKTLKACQQIIPFDKGNFILNRSGKWAAVQRKSKKQFELIFKSLSKDGFINQMFERKTYLINSSEELRVAGNSLHSGKILSFPMTWGREEIGVCMLLREEEESDFSVSDVEMIRGIVNQAAAAFKQLERHKKLLHKEKELKELKELVFHSGKMALVGEMSQGLIHEINNPLQVILGKIQIAILDQGYSESLKQIEKQALRIAALVRTVSEVTRKRKKDMVEVVELDSFIENTIDLVRTQIEKRKISIKFDFDNKAIIIRNNTDYLRRLLLNLIFESKRKMPFGGKLIISTSALNDERAQIKFQVDPLAKKDSLPDGSEYSGSTNMKFNNLIKMLLADEVGGEVESLPTASGSDITVITLPLK